MSEREMTAAPVELETTELVDGDVSVEVVGHRESVNENAVFESEAPFPEVQTAPDFVSHMEQSDFAGHAALAVIPTQRLVLLAPNTVVLRNAITVVPPLRGTTRIANTIEREIAA